MTPEQIREELAKRGRNQRHAARAVGIEPDQFNKVLSRKRRLTLDESQKLRAWLDSLPVLQDPGREFQHQATTTADQDYFDVPAYDIRVAAGDGTWVNSETPEYHLKFRTQWLHKLTRQPAELVVLEISGDSMWETLHDGDHALVDRSQTNPRREGLYVIRVDDVLQVKRITMHPVLKLLTIKSDNPTYPTFENIPPDDIVLLGRVVWIGRRL